VRTFRILGWAAFAGMVVSWIAMQAVSGIWFPPPVSVSQYGVGPQGWIFSLFLLCIGAGMICWYRVSDRPRSALVLVVVGVVGCVVAAVVRTDSGGLQASWHAKVHMVGGSLLLVALPLAVWRMLRLRSRALAVLSGAGCWVMGAALVLLLVAAFGVNTLGIESHRAWALWQGVAMLVGMVLAVLVGVGLSASEASVHARTDPRETATVS
jgi:hypothetical protein